MKSKYDRVGKAKNCDACGTRTHYYVCPLKHSGGSYNICLNCYEKGVMASRAPLKGKLPRKLVHQIIRGVENQSQKAAALWQLGRRVSRGHSSHNQRCRTDHRGKVQKRHLPLHPLLYSTVEMLLYIREATAPTLNGY